LFVAGIQFQKAADFELNNPLQANFPAAADQLCEAGMKRLESIAKQLQALEQKYGMPFEQFDERFQAEELPNPYSYEVEQDYLEWEGLLCRKRRLQEVRDGLR